tara:strand:- start:244 stop:465 length:222 start_codon:yes stop_codon:yes gene_type:complete
MKLNDLIAIKQSDLQANRLTYIVPISSKRGFIRDEMFWVRRFEGTITIAFRTGDGKEYKIPEESLREFKLTGR